MRTTTATATSEQLNLCLVVAIANSVGCRLHCGRPDLPCSSGRRNRARNAADHLLRALQASGESAFSASRASELWIDAHTIDSNLIVRFRCLGGRTGRQVNRQTGNRIDE